MPNYSDAIDLSAVLAGGKTRAPVTAPGAYADDDNPDGYLSTKTLRRQYNDYLTIKSDEIKEQRIARHYYHADQYTADQIKVLNKRKQPIVTSNRLGRKIDGVVGIVERMRNDPKAFPRTPKQDGGADIATAAVRYVTDIGEWKSKRPEAARHAAIGGIGGIELIMIQGDKGDPDLDFDIVEPDLFFYDPRSGRPDFSDARYMGIAKWVDVEVAVQMFPDKEDIIRNMNQGRFEIGADSDRERKWIITGKDGKADRIRLVDHWYQHKGGWCWCVYSGGDEKLGEGRSPFFDEKAKTVSKFIMFSANVDHDLDRYGFVRNLKPQQDEVNARRSKALHYLNTRRMFVPKGSVDNIETLRREAVRPDGMMEYNPIAGQKPEFDDARTMADMKGQLEFLAEAKDEIENFGPNPALIGQGIENKSGRAIGLLQQAGIAELGPFIGALSNWQIRVYRGIWNTVQRLWTQERWIRVTDDDGIAQFIGINQLDFDQWGRPAMVNALGALDVDIILDEGPDAINMQADAYDTLSTLAARGAEVPPGLLIELAPIEGRIKKKYLAMMEKQPDPVADTIKQLSVKKAVAEIADTEASADQKRTAAFKNMADAGATTLDALAPPEPPTGAVGGAMAAPPQAPSAAPPNVQPAGGAVASPGPMRPPLFGPAAPAGQLQLPLAGLGMPPGAPMKPPG